MIRDLYRVWGLWRARGGWLLIGVGVAVASALSAVALLALAGQGVAQGVALGGGALAILLLRPLMLARPALRWAGPAPDAETLARLHHEAHEDCYIANSVTSRVTVEAP